MPECRLLRVHSTSPAGSIRPNRAAAPRTPRASRGGRGARRGRSARRARGRGAGSGPAACRSPSPARTPSSSRLAEASQNSTLSPGATSWPPSTVGVVAVRRFAGDGVVQRRISSMVVPRRPGSARRAASWSGSLDEGQQPAGDGVAGRLGPGREEQGEEGVELHVAELRRLERRAATRARPPRACRRVGVARFVAMSVARCTAGWRSRRRVRRRFRPGPGRRSRRRPPARRSRRRRRHRAGGGPPRARRAAMQIACIGSSRGDLGHEVERRRRRRRRRAGRPCRRRRSSSSRATSAA